VHSFAYMPGPSRHPAPRGVRLALRRGFSLVELLVALIIVDVGLLALVGTTVVLVRERTELRARSAAIRAASARLEWLGAGPCRPTSGSTAASWQPAEQWSVELTANATRELTDSVTFGVGGDGAHVIVVHSRLPC